MNQLQVIKKLVAWLKNQPFIEDCRCDHVTNHRQSLALYIGTKSQGEGRRRRIAEADILLCREGRVELIIEVDPCNTPKKILGSIMPIFLADRYTPSNQYSKEYIIEDCLVIYLTMISEKEDSQKKDQLRLLQEKINHKFNLKDFGIRSVEICFDMSEERVIQKCKGIIQTAFNESR